MKIKLQLLLFLVVTTVKAQYTQVIYVDANKKYLKPNIKSTNKNKSRAIELIDKVHDARKNITFELIYNDKKSVFKRVDMLIPKGKELQYSLAYVSIPIDSYFFKDSKEKYILKENSGEIFKIRYPNNQYDWKITKETKTILGHKCYKAIATYKTYDYGREMDYEKRFVVWFTNDIPKSYGPVNLTGLPGLVLEGKLEGRGFGKFHIKAKEIKSIENFPKIPKGKEIDYIEYNKLQGKMYKKIKSRRGLK